MADTPGQHRPAPADSQQQQQQQRQKQQISQQDNKNEASAPGPSSRHGSHQSQPQPVYFQPQGPHQQYVVGPLHPQFRLHIPANSQHGHYDMSALAQGLPAMADYQRQQYGTGSHGYHSAPSPTVSRTPSSAPGPNFAAPSGTHAPLQAFYAPQPASFPAQQYYGAPVPPMHSMGLPIASPRHGYNYYPNQVPTPVTYYYAQSPSFPHHMQTTHHQGAQGGGFPSAAYPQRRKSQSISAAGRGQPDGSGPSRKARALSQQGQDQTQGTNVVRGPPRKPKQSGHAIWIGNLPPQTDLMSLVEHIYERTAGLESLFLISKSNCAFANFPDEASCLEAQQKLNDTWFKSVRLVSRLRKNAAEGAQGGTAPATAGPGPATPIASESNSDNTSTTRGDGDRTGVADLADGTLSSENIGKVVVKLRKSSAPSSLVVDGTGKARPSQGFEDGPASAPVSGSDTEPKVDRFFILKSLTVEDLELSVRTGVWATQSHNEETLNTAFKSCDNVYLIFSANKSGEYFGYARMTSEINEDPAAAIEFAPAAQAFSETDIPKAIPTEATEHTPRGRIIDDSARGTIFWEVQSDDGIADEQTVQGTDSAGSTGDLQAASVDGQDEDNVAGDAEFTAGSAGGGKPDAPTAERPRVERVDSSDSVDGTEEAKAWGKPFQLEWLSTSRLPFHRTRGMRNPLNANREIKIARDGTEVDASVGRQLVALFRQVAVETSAAAGGGRAMPLLAGGYPRTTATQPSYQ